MSITINTNTTSLRVRDHAAANENRLNSAIEQLASGSRINHAKDNAAGQAIANRLTANIRGMTRGLANINDGLSLALTAEGALDSVNDHLQRIRVLAVQAQSGTLGAADIDSLQDEVNTRIAAIRDLSEQTRFNGTTLFGADSAVTIQAGSQDGQTLSIDAGDSTAWLPARSATIAANQLARVGLADRRVAAAGFDVVSGGLAETHVDTSDLSDVHGGQYINVVKDAAQRLFLVDFRPVVYTRAHNVLVNAPAGQEITPVYNNGGIYLRTRSGPEAEAAYYPLEFSQVGADGGIRYDFSARKPVALSGRLQDVPDGQAAQIPRVYQITADMIDANGHLHADLDTTPVYDRDPAGLTLIRGQKSASGLVSSGAALSGLDDMIAAVDTQRSRLGADQNRLVSAADTLSIQSGQLAAARSRITDTDYAVSVSSLSRAELLRGLATAVLGRANQAPQAVIALLRGR